MSTLDDRTTAHGYAAAEHTDRLLARLKRIEGQVRGLQRMIEEDRYCIDVLTQISSVNRALQGVALTMLDDHVRHCVAAAIEGDEDAGDAKITEALEVVTRLVKS